MSDASFVNTLIYDFRSSALSAVAAAAALLRPDLQPVVTVADRFNRAVAKHQMIIHRDGGLHRHLAFRDPATYCNSFHITTWPGYLAISGDAGCYVFCRLPDMFEFFRGDGINPCYWGEKLQAIDRHGGYREFSEQRFHEAIKNDFDGWRFDAFEEGGDDADRARAWAAIQETDIGDDADPESISDAIQRASEYECPISGNRFVDFWDHDLEDYTFRFLWCCHAIQWAVAQYDASPKLAEAA